MTRFIESQRQQFPFRVAEMGLHPDLAESRRVHGTVHTTGGRVFPGWKLAVADTATQQSRLTDTTGWNHHVVVPPSPMAIQGAQAYASLKGFGDPHDTDYSHIMQTPDRVARVGRHFDSLPVYSPEAVPHFMAMHKEVGDQYDFLTNRLGIKVQPVDYDPYAHVGEMMADVNNNKTLKVLGSHVTGGHPIFGNEGNDKFRAVHDFFGHAATGRDFDRHGEHATYLAHSRMFSPQAVPALTTETLGQNSSLILNGHFGGNKIGLIPRHLTALRHAGSDDYPRDEYGNRVYPKDKYLEQADQDRLAKIARIRSQQHRTAADRSELSHKDDWTSGEQAHYEYHCLQSPESSDYHLWQRSHQPVTVLGVSPNAEDFAEDYPMLDERIENGFPRVYRVRFGDGHEDDAWEDELLTDPRHFNPQHAPPRPAPHTAHRIAMPQDDDEEDEDEEEFDGSYCKDCGKGDGDWCEDCETCSHCDSSHEDHCKSCGPNDSDWCDDCGKCSLCDWDHDAHCKWCGPHDSDWCEDCQQCKSCDGNCDCYQPDSQPTSYNSPLFRGNERPLTKEYDNNGERMRLFLPHDVNPASEAASRPYIDFEREVDHYDTPALDLKLPPAKYTDYERPLHEYHNGVDNIPVKSKGAELYRGLTVNLKHPELAPLRRAIYGDEKESYYSGTPNSHYYPRIPYHKPEPSYQPGMFPGVFSDKELAAGAQHPDRLHKYLDMLLHHMDNHKNYNGLGVHWTTDLSQANSFANSTSPFNNENALLPVRMKARWFGRGEDPYRRNTGEETAGDYEYERELSMLPGAPLNLHDLEIMHPKTKQWHSLMDGEPRRIHAKGKSKSKSKGKGKGKSKKQPKIKLTPGTDRQYKHWSGPPRMWFNTPDGQPMTNQDIFEGGDYKQIYPLLRNDNEFAHEYKQWLQTQGKQPEPMDTEDELPPWPGREFIGFLQHRYPDVMSLLGSL